MLLPQWCCVQKPCQLPGFGGGAAVVVQSQGTLIFANRRSLGFWEPAVLNVGGSAALLFLGRGECTGVWVVYCTDFWFEIKRFFGHPAGEGALSSEQ